MSSQIRGIGGGRVNPATIKKKAPAASGSQDTPSRVDHVSLTREAASLGDLSHVFAQIPVVDGAHVDGIREALAQGIYEINSYQIATKLVEIEFMLNDAERRNAAG